jgi:hypothetical protein
MGAGPEQRLRYDYATHSNQNKPTALFKTCDAFRPPMLAHAERTWVESASSTTAKDAISMNNCL